MKSEKQDRQLALCHYKRNLSTRLLGQHKSVPSTGSTQQPDAEGVTYAQADRDYYAKAISENKAGSSAYWVNPLPPLPLINEGELMNRVEGEIAGLSEPSR